jgi:protein SCO1/2
MVPVIRSALALAACLLAGAAAAGNSPLPFKMGGPFLLTDDTGAARGEADPEGRAQLLFFGYANCPGICTAALPMIGEATRRLQAGGVAVRPVMITVDPERDRVGTMQAALNRFHPDFIGLTGARDALEQAYKAFAIQRELAFVDPEHGPVYVHGSVIFLLDAQGTVLTLFQPIQDPEHVAKVALGYLREE